MESLYAMLFERAGLPKPWNPLAIDPALMTTQEYMSFANEHNKSHPSSAYNVDLESLNNYGNDKSTYTHFINRVKINGIEFEIWVKEDRKNYCKRDENGEYIRIDGQLVPYTDEEIGRLGYPPSEFMISIFDGDKRVAAAQDEWGCMLIMTAKEYRNFGLGTLIGKIARTLEPAKPSGGFTRSGALNFQRVHREFVSDALKSGFYSKLVREGIITAARVKEIIASIVPKKAKEKLDFGSDDPKDWMMFVDNYGSFIVYDRKMADVIERTDRELFLERMIKGYVYCAISDINNTARIRVFGASSPKLSRLLLGCAYTFAKAHGCRLWVEPEEYDIPGFQYGEEEKVIGHKSKEIINGPSIDYAMMGKAEEHFRKTFDKYDEFKHRMHEIADSKFRPS